MRPIERLRAAHPWPKRRPARGLPLDGWLDKGNKRALGRAVVGRKTIVELGSWLGMSALFFAERAPHATVICVDTWEGSIEHQSDATLQPSLGRLYESFLSNVWPARDRVIPIRALSWDGLEEIHAAGVAVDLVYVDASHRQEDVERDLETAIRLFPDALLLGDDWSWASVRAGVLGVARRHRRRIRIVHNCYELVPAHERGPNPFSSLAVRAKIAWRVVDQRLVWPVVRKLRHVRPPPIRPR